MGFQEGQVEPPPSPLEDLPSTLVTDTIWLHLYNGHWGSLETRRYLALYPLTDIIVMAPFVL